MEKTYYRAWMTDKMMDVFPLFDRIEEESLKDWLSEWAEWIDSSWGGYWFVDGRDAKQYLGFPYSDMGYIVKYEEI